ncbi:unnamed protein product [Lepidochelys olivacea]
MLAPCPNAARPSPRSQRGHSPAALGGRPQPACGGRAARPAPGGTAREGPAGHSVTERDPPRQEQAEGTAVTPACVSGVAPPYRAHTHLGGRQTGPPALRARLAAFEPATGHRPPPCARPLSLPLQGGTGAERAAARLQSTVVRGGGAIGRPAARRGAAEAGH